MGRCEYSLPAHDTVTSRDVLKQSDAVSPHACAYACLRVHIHMITAAVTDTQRGEKQLLWLTKGESTTVGGGKVGWSSRLSLQVFVMNVAAAVLFDVPPSWLTDCGRVQLSVLLTPHSSTRWIWCLLTVCHTAVTMNLGWWERGEKKGRSWKCQNRVLHSVALCASCPVFGVFEVSFMYRAYADQSWL